MFGVIVRFHFLAIALFLSSVPAVAVESADSLLLFGFSHHKVTYQDVSTEHGYRDCFRRSPDVDPQCEQMDHSPSPGLKESNPGVGYERYFFGSELFLRGGVYRDSFDQNAFFGVLGRRFERRFGDGWSTSVDLGVGYLNGSGRVGFLPYWAFSFGRDRVHLEMTYLPGRTAEGTDWRADVTAAWLRFEI